MAYVQVEVELDEFSNVELIDELAARRLISKAEKDTLLARKEPNAKSNSLFSDPDWISEARWRAKRGELSESVIMLARAYPEFDALARRIS